VAATIATIVVTARARPDAPAHVRSHAEKNRLPARRSMALTFTPHLQPEKLRRRLLDD
jgi:hypothetical protein